MNAVVTRKKLLLSLVVLTMTMGIFTPLRIYFANADEFFTGVRTLVLLCCSLSFALFSLLSLLFVLAPPTSRLPLLAALSSLTAALWLQGNFFLWNYGVLDGSSLDWQFVHWRTLIDLMVWPGLFLLCLWLGVKKRQHFTTLLLLLLFLQVATILMEYNSYRQAVPTQEEEVPEKAIHMTSQFAFSSSRNVIILVLDAYQSDVFNEYLEAHPEYAEVYPGFVYYPDTATEAFFTEFSIPTLLTGKPLYRQFFSTQAAYQESLNHELMNHSIPARMKKDGYHVGLYTTYAHRYYPPAVYGDIADNYSDAEGMAPHSAGELRQLMIASAFRLAPHSLKKWIHDRWMLEPSLEQDRHQFRYDVERNARIATDQPCFKYYHLQGIHPPQVIDGERQKTLEREPTLRIAREVNSMLAVFLDKLRGLGIYDSSEIFILGDHGLFWDTPQIEFGRFDDEEKAREPGLDIFFKKPRALPLFLHKAAGSKEVFRTDLRPTSLLDLMPTVATSCAWEKEEELAGISLFEEIPEGPRSRRFFSSDYKKRTSAALYEFAIEGFAWHSASWAYTGKRWINGQVQRQPLENYEPGTTLLFGRRGNAQSYLDEHWQAEEDHHCPALSGGDITLPLVAGTSTLTLRCECAPSPDQDAVEGQTLSVYFNGALVQRVEVSERSSHSLSLPIPQGWQSPATLPRRNLSATSPWTALPPPLSERLAVLRLVPSHAGLALYSLVLE